MRCEAVSSQRPTTVISLEQRYVLRDIIQLVSRAEELVRRSAEEFGMLFAELVASPWRIGHESYGSQPRSNPL
eukprot:6164000-Amphidinium_carterae.1